MNRSSLMCWVALLGGLNASCFDPTYPVGQACTPGSLCPPGLECREGTCELPIVAAADAGPDAIPRPVEDIASVAVGAQHSCAVTESGALYCWGEADGGRLGYGDLDDVGAKPDRLPRTVGPVDVGGTVQKVALGARHTCALLDGGDVRCWGANDLGQLGSGVAGELIGDDEVPAAQGPVDLGGPARDIAAFQHHTCALMVEPSQMRCWGQGGPHLGLGPEGMNPIGDDERPAEVPALAIPAPIDAVAVGEAHTCALLGQGRVLCWGEGEYGRLGMRSTDDASTVTNDPVELASDADRLAVGGQHSCARLSSGALYCWGRGANGRLGIGSTDDIGDMPADVFLSVSLPGDILAFAAGGSHTCAIVGDSRELFCWGAAARGRLGLVQANNDIGDDELPATVGSSPVAEYSRGERVVAVAAGVNHSCVIVDGGPAGATRRVRCFGAGDSGALGYGSEDDLGDSEVVHLVGDVPIF